ncbi:MAG: helix-turn-helix transcriptional regulator [Candidatus Binatia bacterium]
MPFSHLRLSARKPEHSAYPKELKTLGDHLRRKRVELGLLQREVAEKLGVSEASVWQWESNQTKPKPCLLPRIIDFLGYAPWTAPAAFGEWLRMARRANGFSRKRLAKVLKVDESTVFWWESGTSQPITRLRKRIAALLWS